jgi:hypothetical protein
VSAPGPIARLHAAWVDRHRQLILVASAIVAAIAAVLVARLPLRPDLSQLLPPHAASVQHLEVLKQRARAFGTVFVVARSTDPALRERAAKDLHRRLAALPPRLVASVDYDDGPARRYFWEHRFLFAPLEDLQEARDALSARVRDEKLAANPLYIDLEDDEDSGASEPDLAERLASLRRRLEDAEARANAPAGFVSEDGELQLLLVRTPFASSDFSLAEELIRRIDGVVAETSAAVGRGVDFGVTGNVVKSLDEHRSVVRGMAAAAAITVFLCAVALLLYYRSVLPVVASLWSLAVGTLTTFAVAKLAIGHLNLVTAFLAAIVVGNGINGGLILLSRYFEELREGREGIDALAASLAGAARGTLAAALAAGVAYGSLVVTDFRGFRHFGIIGFIGMVLCWIAAFTILPAALATLWHRGWIRARGAPAIGSLLARVLPARLGLVAVAGALLTTISLIATYRFVTGAPLQEDWSDLRPRGSETRAANEWSAEVDRRFTTKFQRGLTQRFVIGLERREDVPALLETLEAADRGKPESEALLSNVTSIEDLIPDHQAAKRELLDEVRELLTDDLIAELDADDRALAERVRPPPGIEPLSVADVPEALAWPFTEKDGTRGRLVLATSNLRFKTWNVRHRMEFAEGFRALDLPEGAVVGGQSFVFADLVLAMERDGPRATAVALLGALLVVLVILGPGRHAAVTLGCALAGIAGMIALVSAAGLQVNVIDFIALPITIGLGIDYAVNIAARDRQDGAVRGPRHVLATTGGAVLLCSFTTIVGYGSLLISDSGGIRSFGLAAILGELACVVAAVLLAPALLALLRRRSGLGSAP